MYLSVQLQSPLHSQQRDSTICLKYNFKFLKWVMKFQIHFLVLWVLVVFEYLYLFTVGGCKSTDCCDIVLRSSNSICSDKMNRHVTVQINSLPVLKPSVLLQFVRNIAVAFVADHISFKKPTSSLGQSVHFLWSLPLQLCNVPEFCAAAAGLVAEG